MQDTANAFAEEQIKRSVLECKDIYEMRRLTLQALELLKAQREVFNAVLTWIPPGA